MPSRLSIKRAVSAVDGAADNLALTDKVWAGLIGAALLYESYTMLNSRPSDTMSEGFWNAATSRPLLPLALGIVTAHFAVGGRKVPTLSKIAFGAGFVCGSLFWRQQAR